MEISTNFYKIIKINIICASYHVHDKLHEVAAGGLQVQVDQ